MIDGGTAMAQETHVSGKPHEALGLCLSLSRYLEIGKKIKVNVFAM